MKCLLCNLQFQTVDELQDHYITFHKVDPEDYLFKKLFNDSKNKVTCQSVFNVLIF